MQYFWISGIVILTQVFSLGWSQDLPPSQEIALMIIANPRIILAEGHVSGNVDNATAWQNIVDTSLGLEAQRSSYTDGSLQGPGGMTSLQAVMLTALLEIAVSHKIHVSEIAGGAHSSKSRHYVGSAFDINKINDLPVSSSHEKFKDVMRLCRDLGATEVLGPGDDGHNGHIHCAWPRP